MLSSRTGLTRGSSGRRRSVLAGMAILGLVASTGCQVEYAGMTLPSGKYIVTLPFDAQIVNASIRVNTPFNGGTTNNVQVGSTPGGSDIITAGETASGVGGYKNSPTALAFGSNKTTDTDVYLSFTQTGAAATAGDLDITIGYTVANNEKFAQ